MVADPLRLYHCCPISDGAAAVVLTGEPHAASASPGIGQGTDTLAVRHRRELITVRAPRRAAAREAFAMAGFGPERVDFAEIHDAFAPFELISLEDTGLAAAGQGGPRDARRRYRARRAAARQSLGRPQGARPPAGRDRPRPDRRVRLAAHRPRPGPPARRARRALAQSIGGLATNNWVTLLEARRAPMTRDASRASRCPRCRRARWRRRRTLSVRDHPVAMTAADRCRGDRRGGARSPRCTRRPRASARRCTSRSSSSRAARGSSATAPTRAGSRSARRVAIEAIDDVYYFSHLGALDRARLFWRRTGRAGDRVNAIARSLAKRVWKASEQEPCRRLSARSRRLRRRAAPTRASTRCARERPCRELTAAGGSARARPHARARRALLLDDPRRHGRRGHQDRGAGQGRRHARAGRRSWAARRRTSCR